MKKILGFLLMIFLFVICGCANNESQLFNDYLDDLFIEFIGDSPLTINAILYNPEDYNLHNKEVESIDYTIDAEQAYFDLLKKTKTKLLNFNKKRLTTEDQLTLVILLDYINRELAFEDLYYYGTVLGSYLGYQANLPLMLAEYRFDDLTDVNNYFAYLQTTEASFKSIVNYEIEKLAMGRGLQTIIIDRVISQCDNFLNAEESFLIPTFKDKIEQIDLSKSKKDQLIKQNEELVNNEFTNAYQYLKSQLIKMKKISSNTINVNKEQKKYYTALLKKEIGVDLSIDEVIGYLDNLLDDLLEKLIENRIDYEIIGNSYDLIDDREIDELIPFFEVKMKEDFPSLKVNIEYSIKEIHASLQEYSSPAMYFISPVDTNIHEVIYINPINFNTTNNYVFQTLAHEAYPGHLYQNAYLKNSDLPNIRKIIQYPGYAEGWATYVENYVVKYAGGNEYIQDILSFYNSFPYLVLGRLDIGINYQGWDIYKSQSFLSRYFNIDSIDVTKTYYDMIEVPTNYLKYYFSYYQILDLKEKFKETSGDRYSDYLFHEVFLETGPAPFSILELEYQKYR